MNHIIKTTALAAVFFLSANLYADSVVIIGGPTGNGDFELNNGAATGPVWYIDTPNWFNASGSEGINFTNDSQTGGSSQAGSRAGMPFMSRVQINNTGYVVQAAGEVISVSYDFGAGGNPGNWDGPADESMRTFLFTTTSGTVDGKTTPADMTELGSDSYPIDLANDGQWTSYSATLYTTTAADVGATIFFGMVFENLSGPDLFPRIDVVTVQSIDSSSTTVIGGSCGNGNFEASEPFEGPQWYSDTPSWFNASGSEGINFSNDTQTSGSTEPDSRAGMPFQGRVQVNGTGYTVGAEGESFSLSYDFGSTGNPDNYDGDETFRVFLFTASTNVDGNLTTADMTEVIEVIYTVPGLGAWETGITFDNFYTTTASDIGETLYLGMEMINPAGPDLFPRIDVVNLSVSAGTGTVTLTPATVTTTRGNYFSGDVAEISESDNADYSIRRSNTDIQSRTEFVVEAVSPNQSPTLMEVTLESSVFARTNVNQIIELFDYDSNSWEQIDTRAAARFADSTTTVQPSGDVARFVETGTGNIQARVRYLSDNPRQSFGSNTDLFSWTIE